MYLSLGDKRSAPPTDNNWKDEEKVRQSNNSTKQKNSFSYEIAAI